MFDNLYLNVIFLLCTFVVLYYFFGFVTAFVVHFYNDIDFSDLSQVKLLKSLIAVWPIVVFRYLILSFRISRAKRLEDQIAKNQLPYGINFLHKIPTKNKLEARKTLKKVNADKEALAKNSDVVSDPVTSYGWE